MSNTNRDYLIVCEVKNSKITLARPLNFYITDKNTSNIFIKLVNKIENDNGISSYIDIENSTAYNVTLRIVKPNNETMSVAATQLEPEAIYQVDLEENCKNIAGTYKCELLITTTVNGREELNTSDPFTYLVKKSILSDVGQVIETGGITTEKVLSEIDAIKANYATNVSVDEKIANASLGGGGLTSTAANLLIGILRSAVFTTNQSANITALEAALDSGGSGGGSETTQYVISNNLSNATTNNNTALVDANASYTATITVNSGYTLDAITVTMGGTDITSSAVSGTTITISTVTGNVAITVTTTSSSGGSAGGEMVTDGLENYFDFRTATYNNSGAGGSTIISATQGNGSLYVWANNTVSTQDEYGITQANSRSWTYNGNSVGTATTSLGASFTVIFKCYLTNISSPLFDKGYAMTSNVNKIVYVPKYKTTSGTGNAPDTALGTRKNSGYDTVTLIVDGNICKLYFGTELMQTNDGSTISDFQGWYDQLTGIGILGGNNNGYLTQMAVYNKALSEVELVDMIDYLATLEVK